MKRFRTALLPLLLFAAIVGGSLPCHSASAKELRFATLLPAGSAWMNELHRLDKRLRKKSKGKLRIKFFSNAVMGDERDIVQKMARGQLQGAVLSSVGLGLLLPEIRVLELPLLFKSTAELDSVRDSLTREVRTRLSEKGYLLLGWGDVGWVRLFTSTRPKTAEDLRKLKLWTWADDPLAKAIVRSFGVKFVPLGIQDVLPALQTGLIDSYYNSPYGAIALQWFTKSRYVLQQPLTYAIGGLVISRAALQSLPPDQRRLLRQEAAITTRTIVKHSRSFNAKAMARLAELKITSFSLTPALQALLQQQSQAVWKELAGKLYPKKLLERVLALREAFRRKHS